MNKSNVKTNKISDYNNWFGRNLIQWQFIGKLENIR